MPVSVELQDPYSYSIWPIVIVTIVIIASLIALVALHFVLKMRKGPAKPKTAPAVVFKPKTIADAQREYLAKIAVVEQQYKSNQMDVRTVHQELSAIIRMFVYDVTGVKAQNFSLNELKANNVNQISGLIEEFYAPEFAERTEKQTDDSIRDAREVIYKWN